MRPAIVALVTLLIIKAILVGAVPGLMIMCLVAFAIKRSNQCDLSSFVR